MFHLIWYVLIGLIIDVQPGHPWLEVTGIVKATHEDSPDKQKSLAPFLYPSYISVRSGVYTISDESRTEWPQAPGRGRQCSPRIEVPRELWATGFRPRRQGQS
jgi:hypothetical protein